MRRFRAAAANSDGVLLVGASAVAGSFSGSISGTAAHASYALSALLGFTGLVAIGEGLRWELDAPPTGTSPMPPGRRIG